MTESDHSYKKWGHLRKILERSGPFDTENFSSSPDVLDFLNNDCKILVIGEILNKTINSVFIKQASSFQVLVVLAVNYSKIWL